MFPIHASLHNAQISCQQSELIHFFMTQHLQGTLSSSSQ